MKTVKTCFLIISCKKYENFPISPLDFFLKFGITYVRGENLPLSTTENQLFQKTEPDQLRFNEIPVNNVENE